jgi:hypothetical protein
MALPNITNLRVEKERVRSAQYEYDRGILKWDYISLPISEKIGEDANYEYWATLVFEGQITFPDGRTFNFYASGNERKRPFGILTAGTYKIRLRAIKRKVSIKKVSGEERRGGKAFEGYLAQQQSSDILDTSAWAEITFTIEPPKPIAPKPPEKKVNWILYVVIGIVIFLLFSKEIRKVVKV